MNTADLPARWAIYAETSTPDIMDERNKAKVAKGATRRLEQLGFRVTL